MKVNTAVFWVLAAFFGVEVVLYTGWNLISNGNVEWLGTVGIGLTGVFCAFVAFYLTMQQRGQGGTLPEDLPDANVDDGDPQIGHFAPWSWWPILLAAGAWLVFLGLAVGIWLAMIGAALGIICLIGWTYEYYRGFFAR